MKNLKVTFVPCDTNISESPFENSTKNGINEHKAYKNRTLYNIG